MGVPLVRGATVSIRSDWSAGGRWRSRLRVVIAAASAAAVAVFVPALASASASARVAGGPATHVHARAAQLTRVGTVNFAALANKVAASPSASASAKPRVAPLGKAPMANAGQHPTASARTAAPAAPLTTALAGNVKGAKGFNGINSTASLAVNGFDVSPPDMGMATGTSAQGTAVLQAVNLAVEAFSPSGQALAGPVSLNAFFGLSPAWFTQRSPGLLGSADQALVLDHA